MQRKHVSALPSFVIQASIALVVMASGATAVAQSSHTFAVVANGSGRQCSNHTLFGNYGYSSQGQVLPAPGLSFPFTSTGMTSFDGNGNVSWVEHTVIGGAQQGADWTAASGTYTVNSDCTGLMVVVTPNSPVPLNIFFSVVQQGKQFYGVVNGHAISSVWTRLD
jgi:hypothetical protein